MDIDIIYNEDCIQGMKRIPDNSIDLVVTDCPYHIVAGGCSNIPRKDEPSGIFNRRSTFTQKNAKSGKLFDNNDVEFKDWLPEIYRIVKPNSHVYIMINARNLKELQTECEKVGFKFQQLIVWNKGNATPNRYYLNSCEFILMLRKGNARNINNMGTKNILSIPNIRGNKTHPTEKPIELMKILIENSSNENDIVLDPFFGTGSTLLACVNTHRHYIGYEIDGNYFDIACQRLDEVEGENNGII